MIGAGVLGVNIAFWLSEVYDCSIAIIDKEPNVAAHTSSRNTGVIHRPFYLNPSKKKTFAISAQKSYYLWRCLALEYNLPWRQTGTLEVALHDSDLPMLENYLKWSQINGMLDKEISLLDAPEVKKLEPLVSCAGAIYSKTDTAVDYGKFAKCVCDLAIKNGVQFLNNTQVENIKEKNGSNEIEIKKRTGLSIDNVKSRLVINAAGGNAVDIAHMMGLAKEYTDLHFRGEYWLVDESFTSRISRNIYSVPKHKDFPFLDPHFIVRCNGRGEVGPNAVLVAGPDVYKGVSKNIPELVRKILERPNSPKIKIMTNKKFLSLAWSEWKSSLSKKAMCDRASQFIPSLRPDMLYTPGLAGVRSSLIDSKGFVPEVIQDYSASSIHILNYNSPGATGAPAFSAQIVATLQNKGYLDTLKQRRQRTHEALWRLEESSSLDNLSSEQKQ